MSERTSKKIGAWITPELYSEIESLGYKTWTDAIIKGLELLIGERGMGGSGVLGGTVGDNCGTGQHGTLILEMGKHIETLQKSLEQANKDKEDIKQMYTNHVLQVQTLINQKEDLSRLLDGEKKKPWWKVW